MIDLASLDVLFEVFTSARWWIVTTSPNYIWVLAMDGGSRRPVRMRADDVLCAIEASEFSFNEGLAQGNQSSATFRISPTHLSTQLGRRSGRKGT